MRRFGKRNKGCAWTRTSHSLELKHSGSRRVLVNHVQCTIESRARLCLAPRHPLNRDQRAGVAPCVSTVLLSSKAGRIPEMGIRVDEERSAFIVPDDCVGYVAKPPDSVVNCVIEKKKGTGTTASKRQREQIYLLRGLCAHRRV